MSDENELELGQKIKARRKAKGWSQADLAHRTGSSVRTVGRWENKGLLPTPDKVRALKPELDLTEADFRKAFGDTKKSEPYIDFEYSDVKKVFGDFETFLKHLIQMDKRALRYFDDVEEGDESYWAPFFENYSFTWGALSDGTDVIGYWHFLTLSQEAFERAKLGKFVEVEMSGNDLDEMFSAGRYRMFISMIILESEHRNPAAFSMLQTGFENRILSLAKQGIFFSEVCAYAARSVHSATSESVSEGQGARLCRALGMQEICLSYLDEPVYYMSGEEVAKKGLLSKHKTIGSLYASEFGTPISRLKPKP